MTYPAKGEVHGDAMPHTFRAPAASCYLFGLNEQHLM
jgi:hypothetical protein